MIYTKEIDLPTLTLPEFDYDRLSEMIDGISFGSVVNEAGTNIWDVLQSFVDGLADIIDSIVNIVPDLIKELIHLIIPEDPNFFSNLYLMLVKNLLLNLVQS